MTRADSLLRRLTQRFRALAREHGTPSQLALGLATGVFIGCSPLLGLHSFIALLVAPLLRLNRVAILTGSLISTPPLTLPIVFASIHTGAWLADRPAPALSGSAFDKLSWVERLTNFGVTWTIGSVVIGLGLALLTYLIARAAIR